MATLYFYVLVVLVIGSKGISINSISTGGSRSAPKVARTTSRPPPPQSGSSDSDVDELEQSFLESLSK